MVKIELAFFVCCLFLPKREKFVQTEQKLFYTRPCVPRGDGGSIAQNAMPLEQIATKIMPF